MLTGHDRDIYGISFTPRSRLYYQWRQQWKNTPSDSARKRKKLLYMSMKALLQLKSARISSSYIVEQNKIELKYGILKVGSLHLMENHGNFNVLSLTVSSDSNYLVIGTSQAYLLIWDIAANRYIFKYKRLIW